MRNPGNAGPRNKTAYSLHRGRSRTPLVTVVRDEQSTLYRILWPDIGVSPPANLTRCKAAARDWAERSFLTEHRKLSGARRLKSLNKFWWSASPIEKSGPKDVETTLDYLAAPELSVAQSVAVPPLATSINIQPAPLGTAGHDRSNSE